MAGPQNSFSSLGLVLRTFAMRFGVIATPSAIFCSSRSNRIANAAVPKYSNFGSGRADGAGRASTSASPNDLVDLWRERFGYRRLIDMNRTRNAAAPISARSGLFHKIPFSFAILMTPSIACRLVSCAATGLGSKMVARCSVFVR
jgi:hypothetical protein